MITIGVLMNSAHAEDSAHIISELCSLAKERADVNLLIFPGISDRNFCKEGEEYAQYYGTVLLADVLLVRGQDMSGTLFSNVLEHMPHIILNNDVRQAFAQACILAQRNQRTERETEKYDGEDEKEHRNHFERALEFAMMAHKGQVRKGSEIPYIVHPIETALIAMTLTRDQDVIIAALFHDIIEDTPYSADEIEAAFGSRIVQLVQSNSENKRRGQNAADTWKIRKQEFIDSLDQKTREEKIIALSDKLSNMRATYQGSRRHSDDFWLRFNEKRKEMHHWYYRAAAEKLREFEDTQAWKELDHLIREVYEQEGAHNDSSL